MQKKHEESESKKVYNEIIKCIASRELKPGDHLIESSIAKKFNTSRTPVREAFRRLEAEDILELQPNKGAHIKKTDFTNLINIYQIRVHLAELTSKSAIENITEEKLDELKSLLLDLEDTKDKEKISKIDSKFHLILNSQLENQELEKLLNNLRIKYFTLWDYPFKEQYYLEVKLELQNMVQALDNKNKSELEEILKKHIKNILDHIKKDFNIPIC